MTPSELADYFLSSGSTIKEPGREAKLTGATVAMMARHLKESSTPDRLPLLAISLPLGIDHFSALLAAWSAGYAITIIGQRWTSREVSNFCKITSPTVIVCRSTDSRFGDQSSTLSIGGITVHECHPRPHSLQSLLPTDVWLASSSGSTGEPKAAVLPGTAVTHNAVEVAKYLQITTEDRVLVFTPPHFTYANNQAFSAFTAGANVALWPHGLVSPRSLSDYTRSSHITGISANPSAFEMWLANDAVISEEVRYIVSGGQPLIGALVSRINAAFPNADILNGYGCTENVNRITFAHVAQDLGPDEVASVGYPIAGVEVKIAASGEIVLSGQSLMRGYLDYLESGRPTITAYPTGDVGEFASDGSLSLIGRIKTQLNVGNEMVSPEEVESVVSAIQGVRSCAAGPVQDPILGEVVGLLCVMENYEDRLMISRLIKSAFNQTLARAKRPRYCHYTADQSAIPRTEYGKIDRVALKAIFTRIFDKAESHEQFSENF